MTYEKFLWDIQYLIGRLILDGNDVDLKAVESLWAIVRMSHVMEIEFRDQLHAQSFLPPYLEDVDGAR